MTPWFAAATGFVIAASLWIYSPHGRLTYPITIDKAPRCSQGQGGCVHSVQRQGAPQLAIGSGPLQRRNKSASAAAQAGSGRVRTAASGLSFGYVVRPARNGQFEVVLSVTGKRDFTHWTLAFALPGDHIKAVLGARWHVASSDSGFARPFSGDPSQWRGGPRGSGNGSGGSGYGSGGQSASQGGKAGGSGGGSGQPGVSFTVIASGKPRGPAHCSYDGAACKFHRKASG